MSALPAYHAHRRASFRRPGSRTRSTVLLFIPLAIAALVLLSAERKWQSVTSRRTADRSAIAQREVKQQQVRRPIEYLRQYAAQEGAAYPQECRDHFHGLPYFAGVNASWQAPVCEPQAGGLLGSALRCHWLFDQYPEMHCSGANLALDLAKFEEEDAALPPVHTNRDDAQLFVEHPRPGMAGELLGDCKLTGTINGDNKWTEDSFGKGGSRWMFHSFKSTLGAAQQPRCVAWVEHPVYFMNDKYDSVNLWHALEDVTHAFEAWALKGWGQEAQLVVLDQVSVESVLGPTYLPVWQKVVSPRRPPALLKQLAADARAAAGGDQPGAALCFRDAFFSVHGGISILSRSIQGWTPCVNSTFMRAFSHFVTDGLQLTDVRSEARAAAEAGASAAAGGAQQEGPLLRHHVGARLVLPHTAGDAAGSNGSGQGGGGGAPRMRVMWALRSNRAERQQEILNLLRQRLPAAGAERVPVAFCPMSGVEQIRRVRGADVLAGYHGAALTLACFMDWQGALVEVEEGWRCACYANCARWKDLHYSLIRTYELANGDAPGALAAKVADEVEAALAQVRQRIAGGGASNSGPQHRRT